MRFFSTPLILRFSLWFCISMEDIVSLWSYQEIIDELQRKLLYTTLELESVKMEANEEMKKNEENVKNLLHLLDLAYQERDEAREEIQKLMNKLGPPDFPSLNIPTKANSCITECNSFYDSNALKSTASPVDSLFNGVSSPVFSNSSMAESGNLVFAQPFVEMAKPDPSSAVIDRFVKGKTLPQKGKLTKAVVEAGPLLQTLLIAGPLPQWRTPPPNQLFKIPPVSINHKADLKPLNSSSPYLELSRGSSQTCSASVLNFSNGSSSSFSGYCFENVNSPIPTGKRQRFH